MKELIIQFMSTNPISTVWTLLFLTDSIRNGFFTKTAKTRFGDTVYRTASYSPLPFIFMLIVVGLIVYLMPDSTIWVEKHPILYFLILAISEVSISSSDEEV